MGLLYRFAPRNDSKQVNRLRNKCVMTCFCNMSPNNFTDKGYSLFTTHHSLIHNDTVFSSFTSHFSLKQLYKTKKVRIVFPPFSMFIEYYN